MKEIEEVERLLAEALDAEHGMRLASQLVEIEAWLGRVSKLCSEAGTLKDQMTNKYRPAKMPGLTDLDRTVILDASVADYAADYKYLSDLQDTIRRRCTLGQSLLRFLRTEIEAGI